MHFLASYSDAPTLKLALDLAAGARAFNFYTAGIAAQHREHTVQLQVTLNAGGLTVAHNSLSVSGALVGVAKRTMIMEAISLDSRDR